MQSGECFECFRTDRKDPSIRGRCLAPNHYKASFSVDVRKKKRAKLRISHTGISDNADNVASSMKFRIIVTGLNNMFELTRRQSTTFRQPLGRGGPVVFLDDLILLYAAYTAFPSYVWS